MNMTVPTTPPPTVDEIKGIDFNRNRARRGRPRKYETVEDFEQQADAYFVECATKGVSLTITGLALFMGFYSRQEYDNYLDYDEFKESARFAKTLVENHYEMQMLNGKPVGSIFVLKNMGWRDEKQVDMKSTDRSMTPQSAIALDTSKLTTDQLAALYGSITVTANET